ncbi:MAG: hypothetical protein Q7V01_11645 [Vicinamibacterales bacterium]|nr:hypothetical protein [Vicinamibacterales bacterium]
MGHLFAGLAVAWSVDAASRTAGGRGVGPGLAAACVILAVAPDVDILVTVHRASWHSLTAAAAVAVLAALALGLRGHPAPGLAALTCGLAWAGHVALDWLGRDSSPPHGVMALWPFSHAYFQSGLDLFAEVSRRYWNLDEFVWGNLRSVVREIAIVAPIAAGAWYWRRRRGLRPPRS